MPKAVAKRPATKRLMARTKTAALMKPRSCRRPDASRLPPKETLTPGGYILSPRCLPRASGDLCYPFEAQTEVPAGAGMTRWEGDCNEARYEGKMRASVRAG